MGFLESIAAGAETEEGQGPAYVTGAEKDDIIAMSVPFTISAVEERPSPFDEGVQQYVLTVQLAGEDRLLTFNKGVGSRDRSLAGLISSDELANGPVGPITLRREATGKGRKVVLFDSV